MAGSSTNRRNVPYVLALTILDVSHLTGDSVAGSFDITTPILIGVRDGKIHKTHPEVVSVPTERLYFEEAEKILEKTDPEKLVKLKEDGRTFFFDIPKISSVREDVPSALIKAIKSIMALKLGIADDLERGNIKFEASVAGIQWDKALYPNLENEAQQESLQMINICVQVTKGAELFPKQTASYKLIKWTTIGDYIDMWEDREVTRVGISSQQAIEGVCVTGLCISSTYDVVTHVLGLPNKFRNETALAEAQPAASTRLDA